MKPIKCLIVSDLHGAVQRLNEALRRQRDADAVIFLGDGVTDAEYSALSEYGKRPWLAVRGNCDFSSTFLGTELKKTDSITLGDKKIVYTHGDLFGVKLGMDGLRRLARDTGASVVLFGHTHRRCELYEDGVHYVNPGSLSGSGEDGGCAVMTVTDSGVLFSYMSF